MNQLVDSREMTSMRNTTRHQISELVKRANNVIGLFPGMPPGPYKKNSSTSLTINAARQMLTGCIESLEAVGIGLIVSDEALAEIAKQGIDANFGAKPLQKVIAMEIESPLSQALRNGQFVSGDTIKVYWEGDALVFTNRAADQTVNRIDNKNDSQMMSV